MKRALVILSIFIAFAAAACFADDGPLSPYTGQKISLRASYMHFGGYLYAADQGGGDWALYNGGDHEAELAVEYRLLQLVGFETYADFKGYYFEGFAQYDSGFIRFWGSPNFAFGAAAVLHPFSLGDAFDVSVSLGVEFVGYFETSVDFLGGLGLTARVQGVWKPTSWLGIGADVALHVSAHPGAPEVENPGNRWFPFYLIELVPGISCVFYF